MSNYEEYELIPGRTPHETGQGRQGSPYGPAAPQGPGGPPSGAGGDYGGYGPGGEGDDGYGYSPEPPRRNWAWIVTLVVVAFVFFAIGAALFTLRDRLGRDPEPTPITGTPVALTGTPEWLGTLVAIGGSPAATTTVTTATPATPTPSRTVTVTPTPSPTATEAPCTDSVAPSFTNLYRREVFGCPTNGSQVIWAAWEPFERGSMLWRSDTNHSYWLTLGGQWRQIDAGWDGQPPAGRGQPPPGLTAPERGFGWVWSTDDAIFSALGWATDSEKGFCAEVQEFEQGFMLQSSSVPSCTAENLYNHAAAGDWRTTLIAAHESGVWSGALGGSTVVSAAPTRMLEVNGRPQGNGVFTAIRGSAIQIDGNLSDWPAAWQSISTPVEGSLSYDGPRDASGRFQVGWTAQGMQLAVQVFDDLFRPGPQGTDLWQGDALELQFDGDLVGDYSDVAASSDDYQIGIALNPDGRSLQLYRWLPLAQEGAPPPIGAGQITEGGYTIEIVLPWGYFGLGGVEAARSYGFNLSISDNDSDSPAQETVISASPSRTTYNNPTEWGTLVLTP